MSDKTNGKSYVVKYKLLTGTIILSLIGTSAKAQKKDTVKDTNSPHPETMEITCYKPYIPSNKDRVINGHIIYNQNEPIIGATIKVKGTLNNTSSDINGSFSLKANPNDTLVVSYLGMKTKEILANDILTKKINKIVLEDDDYILCYEVVVVNVDNKVEGVIVDNQNEPIIGANIIVKGTSNNSFSGIDGNFSLEASANDTLVISFLGMKTKEVSAFTSGINKIELEEDYTNITCYIVVGPQPIRRDDIYDPPSKRIKYKYEYDQLIIKPISPVGNLTDFKKWLEANIIYSEQMHKDNLKGEVILSFTVNKKGEIKNKKILSKLSKEADSEVLRVFSLSEKWEPGYDNGKPVDTKVKITIDFNYE